MDEYASTQDYLFSLKARGVKFGIDRMRSWAGALGHPERITPCVHVAGTNGKGSTAAMLESILREAGLTTGLYTSPHLVRLGERVQVARVPLTEREIVDYSAELRPIAEKVSSGSPDDHPSFFEFMTAMAFLQFARKKCDVSVIEVGLGGKLDATNVVFPEVSVITSIALDHCEMLGNTHAQIAEEKGGIIKEGVPVVLGFLPPDAEQVIRHIAQARNAPVHSVRAHFGPGEAALPVTNLEGAYQRRNAGTATLVARLLRPRWPAITDEIIAKGLRQVEWTGRWQRMEVAGRTLVLDASHNEEGAGVLAQNLEGWSAAGRPKPIVVVGVLGAERARPLMHVIARYASEIHLVVPNQARACDHDSLAALVPADFPGPVHRSFVERLFPGPGLLGIEPLDTPVLVTGSIYLLGEILARLEPSRGAGEGRLQDF